MVKPWTKRSRKKLYELVHAQREGEHHHGEDAGHDQRQRRPGDRLHAAVPVDLRLLSMSRGIDLRTR
jgi:hypothetical protein